MKPYRLYGILLPVLFTLNTLAQPLAQPPNTGEVMPDFEIRNIEYYPKPRVRISDFKGKWLLLDYWHKTCSACFASMPKLSELSQELKNEITVISIGREDRENMVRSVYEKFRKRYDLKFPVAFDSNAHHALGVRACPVILLVDPQGVIRAATYHITIEDVKRIMNGEKVVLPNLSTAYKETYDPTKMLLVNGNGGNDTAFLFRSLLSQGSREIQPMSGDNISRSLIFGKFEVTNVPLVRLYNYAYFDYENASVYDSLYGNISFLPIVDSGIRQKFDFKPPSFENLFSYSIKLPPELTTLANIQKIMQRDLEVFFGYQAKVETRMLPYWSLRANKAARNNLRTRGGPSTFSAPGGESVGFSARNINIKRLIGQIWTFHQRGVPIINETGIQGNIDITIDAIFTDIESIRAALRTQGLDLVKAYKEMKTLVITAPKKEVN